MNIRANFSFYNDQYIDNLVEEFRDIECEIRELSEENRTRFYAKLYNIPTDFEMKRKIDILTEEVRSLKK